MQCKRCQINALKDQLLAQYPNGDIPPSKAQPLYARCIICSHGCRDAKGKSRCDTFTRKTQLETKLPALVQDVAKLKKIAQRNPALYGFALTKKQRELDDARQAFAACRQACLHCDRSADDNPSNEGICFVSRDAATAAADSGDADNRALGDWMTNKSVLRDPNIAPGGLPVPRLRTDSGISALPPEAEDALRKELANFSGQASLVDKILAAVLLTQKPRGRTNECYNLSDFAKLRWIFDEDRSHKIYETEVSRFLRACGWVPKTELPGGSRARLGISKQAVSVRFKNLVRKVPFLAAVAARTLRTDMSDGSAFPPSPPRRKSPRNPILPKTYRFSQLGLLDDSFALPVADLPPSRATRHHR